MCLHQGVRIQKSSLGHQKNLASMMKDVGTEASVEAGEMLKSTIVKEAVD